MVHTLWQILDPPLFITHARMYCDRACSIDEKNMFYVFFYKIKKKTCFLCFFYFFYVFCTFFNFVFLLSLKQKRTK